MTHADGPHWYRACGECCRHLIGGVGSNLAWGLGDKDLKGPIGSFKETVTGLVVAEVLVGDPQLVTQGVMEGH